MLYNNYFKKVSCLAVLSALAFSANADAPGASGADNSQQSIPIIIIDKKDKNLRPKLPSRQHVECVYIDGTLHFDFVIPEGEAVLTVTDALTGISAQYVFDTDAHAEVTIGYLSAASLEIHTDAGNTYTGTIQ